MNHEYMSRWLVHKGYVLDMNIDRSDIWRVGKKKWDCTQARKLRVVFYLKGR